MLTRDQPSTTSASSLATAVVEWLGKLRYMDYGGSFTHGILCSSINAPSSGNGSFASFQSAATAIGANEANVS